MNKITRRKDIIIVSGLPRSGTSMMMNMLEMGGVPVLTDRERTADKDNPRGYFEHEKVKKLRDGEVEWLKEAKGKAVKIIATHLPYLPEDNQYQIIFMERMLDEIIASQNRMLINRGKDTGRVSDGEMKAIFEKHLKQIHKLMKNNAYFSFIRISYNNLLKDPDYHIEHIVEFLGLPLNRQSMVDIIDPELYRHRAH